MSEQLIITLGREYKSGGRDIAMELARHFSLPLYEQNILKQIAETLRVDADTLTRYDEVPKNLLFSRTVNMHSSAPEEVVCQLQFDYLRKCAAAGESFVVLGRCGEEVLKDFPGLVSIFVYADPVFRKNRAMELEHVSEAEAMQLIAQMDKKRKLYHNQNCKGKWGDARNYHIAVNSACLGVEGTAEFLKQYIEKRIGKENI